MLPVTFSEGCGKGLNHTHAIIAAHTPIDTHIALLRSLLMLLIPCDGKPYPTKSRKQSKIYKLKSTAVGRALSRHGPILDVVLTLGKPPILRHVSFSVPLAITLLSPL